MLGKATLTSPKVILVGGSTVFQAAVQKVTGKRTI